MLDETDSWDAVESWSPPSEQERLDRVRVHGYALAQCNIVLFARDDLELAVTEMLAARKRASKALEALKKALKQADLAIAVVVASNPEWTAEVAMHLEEIYG